MVRDTRDLRDPEALGNAYLRARAPKVKSKRLPIGEAASLRVALYEDGAFISADPSEHHSKTDQSQNYDDGTE